MYYQYWGLKKPPFDNVPDPTMYVEFQASVENAIAETLFAIEEGDECLAVIVGDVGMGKTLSLRIILDSLEQEKYKIALITNPDISFIQLLREIIGQLTGKQCEVKRRVELLEIFNKLLFETVDQGKRILIFIDEANAIAPANLESLRLLTNMQEDSRNLFTIVLSGQLELARRLEHPKHANLFQRIGTYNRIDKLQSAEMLTEYIETRLKHAGGGQKKIFTEDAIEAVWVYSEFGVPRLVNKICKLCLKAGETNEFEEITGDVVKQIGTRFQRLTGPTTQKRKPRIRHIEEDAIQEEKPIPQVALEEEKLDEAASMEPENIEVEEYCEEADSDESELEELASLAEGKIDTEELIQEMAVEEQEEEEEEEEQEEEEEEQEEEEEEEQEEERISPLMDVPQERLKESHLAASAVPQEEKIAPKKKEPKRETTKQSEKPTTSAMAETTTKIGKFKISRLNIPSYIIKQAKSSTKEHRFKLAGVLAAQTLKKYPQLKPTSVADPVTIWSDIRDLILHKMEQEIEAV
ncbi:MAG: AAA family ATPase [Thermodesulfobacteriota bacterium]|nr:AAA family ATPase [Thermodesulfobacteriota bacterium]